VAYGNSVDNLCIGGQPVHRWTTCASVDNLCNGADFRCFFQMYGSLAVKWPSSALAYL
jgi:hypothetical protein